MKSILVGFLVTLAACSSSESDTKTSTGRDAAVEVGVPDVSWDVQEAGVQDGPDGSVRDGAQGVADSSDGAIGDTTVDSTECKLARPYSTKDVDCNACVEQRCCSQMNECLLAPDCDDLYVNCLLVCMMDDDAGPKDECKKQCGTDYPNGKRLYDAAIGCADTKCLAECS